MFTFATIALREGIDGGDRELDEKKKLMHPFKLAVSIFVQGWKMLLRNAIKRNREF